MSMFGSASPDFREAHDQTHKLMIESRREEREFDRWKAMRALRSESVATVVALGGYHFADDVIAEAKKIEAYLSGASGT